MVLVAVVILGFAAVGTAGAQYSDDRFEANDDQSSATDIPRDVHYVDLTITENDQDYYAVSVDEGEDIDVDALFSHADGDLDVDLIDPSGSEVAGSLSTSDDESIEHTARSSGTYYIVVRGYSGATNSYELMTTVSESTSADLRSIEYGQTSSGEIDTNDPSEYRGNYEPVTFQGSSGDRVTVEMTSDGDTYLMLLGPNGDIVVEDDDGGSELNSEFTYTLEQSGEYTIIATSFSSDARFVYDLSLSQSEPTDGDDLRSIEYGQTASGEIDDLDPSEYRGNHEPVTFQGSSGDRVTIDMTSEGDTYLLLLGPSGDVVAGDDDGGDGLNSQISHTLGETGQYTIIATSFSSDARFVYDLSLSQSEPEDGADLRSIEYGQTASGEIDDLDPSEYRGNYEPVTFRGSSGDTVTIDMTSEGDTYLMLLDPNGNVVAQDDDAGDGFNSRLTYTLGASGQYTIVATSYSNDARFPYTLSLTQGESSIQDGADLRSIEYGQTAEGEIDRSDPSEFRGNFEPVFFQGSAGDQVTIDMTSETGDTYLMLLGPGGDVIAEDDDGGVNLNSQITYSLEESGRYTIIATSFDDQATFEYALSLSRSGSTTTGGADLRSIAPGLTAAGEIDANDPSEYRGNYEPVVFQGSAGQEVTVSMSAEEGDTYLLLLDPSGTVVAEDDDGGDGFLNSQLSHTLESSGQYTIIATSYGNNDRFTYELSLDVSGEGASTTDQVELSANNTATAGGTIRVQYTLENTGDSTQAVVLNTGAGIDALGGNWQIRGHEDAGGVWRSSQGTWLFDDLQPGETVTPTVTLDVPDGASGTFMLAATAENEEGRTSTTVDLRPDDLTVTEAVDQNGNGELDDSEILTAVEAWRTDSTVGDTDVRLSNSQIINLIELWRQGGA